MSDNTRDDLLAAALKLHGECEPEFWGAVDETAYGFPLVRDARDFLPDLECSEPDELIAWKADYDRAVAGEVVNWPGCYWATPEIHVAATRWGLGLSRLREDEA